MKFLYLFLVLFVSFAHSDEDPCARCGSQYYSSRVIIINEVWEGIMSGSVCHLNVPSTKSYRNYCPISLVVDYYGNYNEKQFIVCASNTFYPDGTCTDPRTIYSCSYDYIHENHVCSTCNESE